MKYEYIKDTASLNAALQNIKSDIIALDTEFWRQRTYFPELCLIQLSHKDANLIIDAMAKNIDLSPLKELLLDSDITKILHSCKQDIEVLQYHMDIIPTSIYDTQIAARNLDYGQAISYGMLVEDFLDIELDKSRQFSEWNIRPLSDEQLLYAAKDSAYLLKLYEIIRQELKAKDLDQATNKLMQENIKLYEDSLDLNLRAVKFIPSRGKLNFRKAVHIITLWREHKAAKQNIPRKWVLNSDEVFAIANLEKPKLDELKQKIFSRRKKFLDNRLVEALSKIDEVQLPDKKLAI